MPPEVIEAFNTRWTPEPNSGCWLWTGNYFKGRGGYGAFTCRPHNIKLARAHRLSYAIHRRPVTEDEHVLHTCDTPSCVNPDHLFVGNQLANMQDKARKERQNRGETHGMVKLAEQDVLYIRQHYRPYRNGRELAKKFRVSLPTISDIYYRRSWAHVP
jgi:hypothetical protein